MIWRNPWAWLGLSAVAVPIVIHLLGRRRARRQPFPTLRFLAVSRVLPARRHQLTDPALLAIRIAVVAAAAVALAQPFLMTAARRTDLGRTLARAVVVDASASMTRPTPAGAPAIDAARAIARTLIADAAVSTTLEAADPAGAVPGALGWLAVQPGRHELVVISDFQIGAIDARDLALVPGETGVRLVRVDIGASANVAPAELTTRHGAFDTTSRITLTADRTDVAWTTSRRVAADPIGPAPLLLTGPAERARADAAREAASTLMTARPDAAGQPAAIVYAHAAEREALLRGARALDRPWMADAVARLRRDDRVNAAARTASRVAELPPAEPRFTTVASDADGHSLVLAASGDVQGAAQLIVFSFVDAGSVLSAALIAGVSDAVSISAPISELDPQHLPDATLQTWQRDPASVAPPDARDESGPSDGRWLWVLALVLLAIEAVVRRTRRVAISPEAVHERVA